MRNVIDPEDNGPIIVYHATTNVDAFRRWPKGVGHTTLLQRYLDRIFDLLPVVKNTSTTRA